MDKMQALGIEDCRHGLNRLSGMSGAAGDATVFARAGVAKLPVW